MEWYPGGAPRMPRRASTQGQRSVGSRLLLRMPTPEHGALGEAGCKRGAETWRSKWGLPLPSPWQPNFWYQYLLSCAQEEKNLAGLVGVDPGSHHPPSRGCYLCPKTLSPPFLGNGGPDSYLGTGHPNERSHSPVSLDA